MSKKILVADDEPNIVTALEFLLQRQGFEVQVARNGDEALSLIESARPDLVLLDVMMPLKSRAAEGGRGLDVGADLYITKPFSTRDLVGKIKGLLGA
jgi:DNA-binding response OmpR family regulator